MWAWKEQFPQREEIAAYVRHISEILELRENIRFNTRISKAVWHAKGKQWEIYSSHDGAEKKFVTASFFIPCTGYTGQRYIPDIPGLTTFPQAFHTSEWPLGLNTDGKRVGVIGTGSSGVQIIETLAPDVASLTVFQRSPNYAIPRPASDHSEASNLSQHSQATTTHDFLATSVNNCAESPGGFLICPTTDCDKHYQTWVRKREKLCKGQQFCWENYRDLFINENANNEAYIFWRNKTRQKVQDQYKCDLLAPICAPHPFGAKRPALESKYFEIFNQSNVDLVDLNDDEIFEIGTTGIHMKSGKFYHLDIIVLATGYHFGTGSLLAIDIQGKNGLSLREKWGSQETLIKATQPKPQGVMTYLGLTCAGFPNLLFICGPQTPAAFSVAPKVAESQVEWIGDFLQHVCQHGWMCDTIEQAEAEYKERLGNRAEQTLISRTKTWYMSNKPGQKHEPLFWFGSLEDYMDLCRTVSRKGYIGFIIG